MKINSEEFKKMVEDLELFKEELDEYEQKFVEDVLEYYYIHNTVTSKQLEWLQRYYLYIQNRLQEDSLSWQ